MLFIFARIWATVRVFKHGCFLFAVLISSAETVPFEVMIAPKLSLIALFCSVFQPVLPEKLNKINN